jgi:periplasmic protein TonB
VGVARSIRYIALVTALLGVSPPVRASGVAHPQAAPARPSQPTVLEASPEEAERPLPPGVYRAGQDVSAPTIVRQVAPNYTADAMRKEIHGIVRLDCVVRTDGSVGDVRVVRSLDRVYGLDDEAIDAAKQWTFEPGLKDGEAVPVMVTIDMTFAMDTPVRSTRDKR